mgnify:CR=1 FL=1
MPLRGLFLAIATYICDVARIMAIDYGTKRTGIAVTDPLQIIANGLDTVETNQLLEYLEAYFQEEEVETVVVGEPQHADGTPTYLEPHIIGFIRKLKKQQPEMNIVRQDERFTSVMAKEALLESGLKKKKRREKGLIDKMAATILLQEYLEAHKY